MAIRFDPNLNNEIRKTVRNFNAKVTYNKHKTRGKGMLPEKISIKDIKEKYSDKTRKELLKQLKLYQSFSNRDALQRGKDSRLSKWEKEYFKSNLEKTKEFYDKEIEDLNRIVGDKPEYYLKQHHRLNDLKTKRDYLVNNLNQLSEGDINKLRNAYNYAERSEIIKQKGFRLYLDQVDRLLTLRNVPKKDRDALLNKFNVLSENQFTEMVRKEDLIDRMYDLVHSPEGRGTYELTVDDAEADALIQDLWNNADDLIAKYLTNE